MGVMDKRNGDMMKIIITAVVAMVLSSCTSSRLSDVEKRLSILEAKDKAASMTMNQLTDKVFDGKSVTIRGITYYPEPEVFENEDYKVYYRKKKGELYLDVVLISKKIGMVIVGADSAKLEGQHMITQGGTAVFEQGLP